MTMADQPMIALSIMQPWPWLILNCWKDVENRSWPTRFRGRFMIHAGKGFDKDGFMWLANNWHRAGLPSLVGDMVDRMCPDDFERGGIVGSAVIVDCVTTSESPWFVGRYGFKLREPLPLPFRPLRGQLGFFKVDANG